MNADTPATVGPLVSTAWLAERLAGGADVRVVDCRWYLAPFDMRDPDAEYARGHIPGAVHLRWDTQWADADHPIPGMLAQPEAFAETMAAAGIGERTTVVAYDDGHVTVAAPPLVGAAGVRPPRLGCPRRRHRPLGGGGAPAQ